MLRFLFIFFSTVTSLSAFYEWDCYEKYWVDAEFLYWQIQEAPKLIPLIVEGPVVPDGFPVFNQPGNTVVLGDKKIESKWRSGGRFSFGFWGCELCAGVEFNYLFLGKSSFKKSVSSEGSFFSIPFINSITGQESSIAFAVPGDFEGSATLKVTNSFQGAEINSILRPCCCYNNETFEIFGGVRYINFSERLTFNTSNPFIDPGLNDIFFTKDKFRVDNNFYGGQIGFTLKNSCGPIRIKLKTKLAFGAICHAAHIKGDFYTNDFTGFTLVQHFNGGYFALPSNSGHPNQTRFSVVPEVDLNLGYQIINGLTVHAGYNFLYIANVLRASKLMNRKINPTGSPLYQYTPFPVLVGTPRPKKEFNLTNMWIQGINVGLEFEF